MRGSLESCACSRSCLQDSTCSAPRCRAAAKERESGYDLAWVNQALRCTGSRGDLDVDKGTSAFGAARSASAFGAPAELAWLLSMETSFSVYPPVRWR